ncbi:hypothetical protein HDU76_008688, partial [Blyttiomyces sp. JEL0837]
MMTTQEYNNNSYWSDFKSALKTSNQTLALSCFSDITPTIVCVPTGTGTDGSKGSLTNFVKNMISQQEHKSREEQILSQVESYGRLVEETILTIVHDGPLDWMLPEVKPTRKRITFPVIYMAQLDNAGKIQNLRIYWEQATVLRQIGVLPNSLFCKGNNSETVLPVLGPRIVDRIKEPLNTAYYEDAAAPMVSTKDLRNHRQNMADIMSPENSDAPLSVQTRPQPQRPGGPSQMSDILSASAAPEAIRPSSRVLQRPGGAVSDIFNTGPAPAAVRVTQRAHVQSQVFSDEPEVRPTIPVDPRRFQQNINVFEEAPMPAYEPEVEREVNVVAAGGSDRGGRHGGGGSVADSFRQQQQGETAPVVARPGLGRRDPNWSSLSEVGDDYAQPAFRSGRRMYAQVDSNVFGSNESV